jgi:hypothetical protein
MEIKPPGAGGPLPPISDQNQPVTKFSKVSRPAAAGTPQSGLGAVTAEYRKADLKDPAKADEILSRCAGELVQSVLPRTGANLAPASTAEIAEWLQNDPVMRGKLLNYLERVLS